MSRDVCNSAVHENDHDIQNNTTYNIEHRSE